MKKSMAFYSVLIAAGVLFYAPFAFSQAGKRPNIIVIYADDLGFKEVSAFGNTRLSTPNIDALGKEGVKFTQAYSTAPICSPSRAGLMTGRYQQRFGFEYLDPIELPYSTPPDAQRKVLNPTAILRPGAMMEPNIDPEAFKALRKGIPETELTLAEVLKANGYNTALIGKWHLGEKEGFYPTQNGFDYFFGCLNWGTLYANPSDNSVISRANYYSRFLTPEARSGSYSLRRNKDSVNETTFLTDKLAEEALSFIEDNKNNPFFLYLPFTAVHDPLQAKKTDFDKISSVTDSATRIQLAMTKELDDAVGLVLAKLKALGLDDNTIIFFSSDNGGPTYYRTVDNAPLKGGKLSHFEGGIRVPYFIKFPGKVPAGKTYENPVSNMDIFATALAVANVQMPDNREIDGVNLLPFISNQTNDKPHDILFWRNGYSKAVRKGDWKLYMNDRNNVKFLYDLSKDPGETTDLSAQYPDKFRELTDDFKNWEKKTIKPMWSNTNNVLLQVGNEAYFFPI